MRTVLVSIPDNSAGNFAGLILFHQPKHRSQMMNGTKRIRALTELGLNSPATVARMKLDQKETDRLADLGLRTGVEVRVLQAAPEAPLLLAVLDARIAVNYETE